MVGMGKQKPEADKKRNRNVIFVTLDESTEAALRKFLADQRIPPDRSAVAFTAIVEFLTREGYKPEPDDKP